jgi:hypothetical protein
MDEEIQKYYLESTMKKTPGYKPDLSATKVAQIILEDFIGPFICWDNSCKLLTNRPNKKEHSPRRKKKKVPSRAKKQALEPNEEIGKTRKNNEQSSCEELTDFHALSHSSDDAVSRHDHGEEREDMTTQETREMITESYAEHKHLRKELESIREERSRLNAENENWKRLYETSKRSSNFQEEKNQEKNLILKARNDKLLQQGEQLQQELNAMKRQIEVLRRERKVAVQHLDTSIF